MARRSKGGGRRGGSSGRWLRRQQRDTYARRARETGRISRAHFKLEQLDRRFSLLRPGLVVLELGAAPGGWTRYVEERIGPEGLLVAVDERPITATPATRQISARLGTEEADDRIAEALSGRPADLVLSDMAPNLSGIRAADQARAMELVALAQAAADRYLRRGGLLVAKVFQGEGLEEWTRSVRARYRTLRQVKPDASRPDSREMYVVAGGFEGPSADAGHSDD